MANSWLRLWHEMPNDPKWRTIARISGQPISLVQAIYIHLLVSASQNPTRGHVAVKSEDLASALDSDDDAISAVLNAMQGRVLDDDYLTGWECRQTKREDLQPLGWDERRSNRPSAEVWRRIRTTIFERDDYTCQYCGARGVKLECDHVIPVSRGGSSDLENLATACFTCNRSKRDKTPDEWMGVQS